MLLNSTYKPWNRTLAVRLLVSGNLNLSGNQEMDFELIFLKSSKIGVGNILCREKLVIFFFKVERFKFNEVIKSNFKIYFPFIKIVFHWFKGNQLKNQVLFQHNAQQNKHNCQHWELFLMGGMQNCVFVRTSTGPDVIYSPIPSQTSILRDILFNLFFAFIKMISFIPAS